MSKSVKYTVSASVMVSVTILAIPIAWVSICSLLFVALKAIAPAPHWDAGKVIIFAAMAAAQVIAAFIWYFKLKNSDKIGEEADFGLFDPTIFFSSIAAIFSCAGAIFLIYYAIEKVNAISRTEVFAGDDWKMIAALSALSGYTILFIYMHIYRNNLTSRRQ